ncbi:MAG: dioxygenase [Verrucomicrobiae bacterium]|nr:dioxygenase [Verrucomicrobiae bacterium]
MPADPMMKVCRADGAAYSVINLGRVTRVALMVTPQGRGDFRLQAEESLRTIHDTLAQQPVPQTVTFQTVFLKDANDQAVCDEILAAHYGAQLPVTTYLYQPPCDGAALAIEAWAIGGDSVRFERPDPNVLQVTYDDLTWTYCGGINPRNLTGGVYAQSLDAFEQMKSRLARAGVAFDHVMRTWLVLGGITELEGKLERYMELNRARTDFYQDMQFGSHHVMPGVKKNVYPASTGIGMNGLNLAVSCMALDTPRKDVFLLPLENPQQTPVYYYEACYSPKSPKFVRAMAGLIGDYVTIWVSGTASIVQSKTLHVGDARKQTEQTIDNIECLIAPDNLAQHGAPGAGAKLSDLAKVRVYVKRPEDYAVCREVCERRFGNVPAVYIIADVCRSDLLVEIEGVAFVKRASKS